MCLEKQMPRLGLAKHFLLVSNQLELLDVMLLLLLLLR
jgi:hypothetical protein